MSKHTPGPWSVGHAGKQMNHKSLPEMFQVAIHVGEPNLRGNCLAISCGGGVGALSSDEESVLANARLIAAAPELLAMLERTRDELEASGGFDGDESLFSDIVGLIAKATGAAE